MSFGQETKKYHREQISQLKDDIRSGTFLVKNRTSSETFYMHVLRYYLPLIAEETFSRHNVGVGVFNIQGFERRNRDSKRCMELFSNSKGNKTVNNMKRLFD